MGTICLDTGALRRSPELPQVVAETDAKFVVTDASIMELCKSDQWERTIRDSLKPLSTVPERVFCTLGNGELMRAQFEGLAPLEIGDLVGEKPTMWLRALLKEIAGGTSGKTFEQMPEAIREANQRMAQGHLDHVRNREMLMELLPTIQKNVPTELLSELRGGRMPVQDVRDLVTEFVSSFLPHLEPPPVPKDVLETWIRRRSYVFRWTWLRARTVVEWIAKGGLDSAKPAAITNSDIDRQILTIGSYCTSLLTEDNQVREFDADLRSVIESPSLLSTPTNSLLDSQRWIDRSDE